MPSPAVLSSEWNSKIERVNYNSTAEFLNECIDNCKTALDQLRTSDKSLHNRWWTALKFFAYDKPTKDAVEGAAPLKPALVGVMSDEPGDLDCYWGLPCHLGTLEFMSDTLIDAAATGRQHVQNPVDDLQSFMWTAVWGTVHNPRAKAKSDATTQDTQDRLWEWRQQLTGERTGRTSALRAFEQNVPPIVKQMSALVRAWRRALDDYDLELEFGDAFEFRGR
ncbi:hypothetical protein C8Q80DRAFT_1266737 [Daedaleopsis nitida]|nr:hypothetical protein C8Q80DRAFT_1266737 [Daedaleopsis nitida]